MVAVVGWPDVLVALIAGLPGIIAAVAALLVRREVKTPNGDTLAHNVQQLQATATETRGVVARTLGQRKEDQPPATRDKSAHKRSTDE